MRLPLLAAVLVLGACTPTTYNLLRDPPDYVDRVLEDVTAILEGMAAAHRIDQVVIRDPAVLPHVN